MVSEDVLIKKYATVLSKNPDDVCDKTESLEIIFLSTFNLVAHINMKYGRILNTKKHIGG